MAAQFASPTEQVSQWFASPGIEPTQHFTPIVTGFTPTQSTLVIVMDTPISRSLGATFSELIGQPTSPEFRARAPITAAHVTGTTKTIPSSIASSEPPLIVTATLEVLATATVEATLPIVTPSEPQGQATTLASSS